MKISIGRPASDVIKLAYRANKPVLLVGPHGIGKSSLVHAAASELGIDVKVRDLSLMEPVDLVGMPQIANGITTFAPPSFLPRDGQGIFLLEEINRSPIYMRAPCLELLTSRKLNDYRLPDGWVPMAAINPTEGYVDTVELDIALLSRFVCVEVTASLDDWCCWARNNQVHEQIIQFVEQSSGALDSEGQSPRSWVYASDLVKVWENESDHNDDVLAAALAGTLGDNWALAFLQFYRHGRKPLSAKVIIGRYPAHRAGLKRWLADGQLDLVAASLELLKRHLQPKRHYNDLIKQAPHKANVETFFGDLPPDLKQQVKDWLEDRGFTNLSVPGRTRK